MIFIKLHRRGQLQFFTSPAYGETEGDHETWRDIPITNCGITDELNLINLFRDFPFEIV
jgi:hypothetical protein